MAPFRKQFQIISTSGYLPVQTYPDTVERLGGHAGKESGIFPSGQQRIRICRNAVAGYRPVEARYAAADLPEQGDNLCKTIE